MPAQCGYTVRASRDLPASFISPPHPVTSHNLHNAGAHISVEQTTKMDGHHCNTIGDDLGSEDLVDQTAALDGWAEERRRTGGYRAS